MFRLSLGRRDRARDDERERVIAGLKARLRAALALGDDDGLTVNEIACADPGCPAGVETVVLVMRRGDRTRALKIPKTMDEVDDADIAAALTETQKGLAA